jgi:hypothetical protein
MTPEKVTDEKPRLCVIGRNPEMESLDTGVVSLCRLLMKIHSNQIYNPLCTRRSINSKNSIREARRPK